MRIALKFSKRSIALLLSSSLFFAASAYDYTDSVDASKTHPGSDSIPLEQVPMFISFGWDDNGIADKENLGGTSWFRTYMKHKTNPAGTGNERTFDGSPMRSAFYLTGKYGMEWVYENYPDVRELWKLLKHDGHEVGNHSTYHLMRVYEKSPGEWTSENYNGKEYSKKEWYTKELKPTHDFLTKEYSRDVDSLGMGFSADELYGWRTPRLEWNDNLLAVLKENGYIYDCSMELEAEGDGTDFWWPHTLNNGSPAHKEVKKHAGLWEMPAYRFVIPESLRGEEKVGDSIMTGLDYNVWAPRAWGALELSGPEFTEILKYTLDQRMKGNRAPMLVGGHTDIYTEQKNSEYPGTANARARQKAIEDFIDYAVETYPEVRFVTPKQIIDWMREPAALVKTSELLIAEEKE